MIWNNTSIKKNKEIKISRCKRCYNKIFFYNILTGNDY